MIIFEYWVAYRKSGIYEIGVNGVRAFMGGFAAFTFETWVWDVPIMCPPLLGARDGVW
jgi:hypothetical protein